MTDSQTLGPPPPFSHSELFGLLERPDIAARMEKDGLIGPHLGFRPLGRPDPEHDRLWAMVLAERPDWRPWYEWARALADHAFAEHGASLEDRGRQAGPGIPHEEVGRRLGLDMPDM